VFANKYACHLIKHLFMGFSKKSRQNSLFRIFLLTLPISLRGQGSPYGLSCGHLKILIYACLFENIFAGTGFF